MEAPMKVKKKHKRKNLSTSKTKDSCQQNGELDPTISPAAPNEEFLQQNIVDMQVEINQETNSSHGAVLVTSVSSQRDESAMKNVVSSVSPPGSPVPIEHDVEIVHTVSPSPIQSSSLKSWEGDVSVEEAIDIISPAEIIGIYPSPIVEEVGESLRVAVSKNKPITIYPMVNNVEICEEAIAINVVPSAPGSCESGDFFSLQSIKHSLENVAEVSAKNMNQILEEDEMQYRFLHPVQPVESSKIAHMYSNFLLENKEQAIQSFLSECHTSYPGFELYELLSNYLRASNQLSGCEKSLLSLKDQCEDFEKQVWTVSSQKLTQEGTCQDQNTVVGTYNIHVANLNSTVFSQLNKVLKDLKELLKDSFPLHIYTVQLCKTQIDHFFYKSFHHINSQYLNKQGAHGTCPTVEVQNDAELLKLTISTLFLFVRKAQVHSMFLLECKTWLEQAVGLLLRIATLEDHMFLLNHVIRCPPGAAAKWASKFVQVPVIPIPHSPSEYVANSFGHLHLDYSLSLLSCILNPVPKRDEFLHQNVIAMQQNIGANDSSLQWVVVDSDGEDEPEDSVCFKESDIVALLNQVPFESIFSRALHVYQSENNLVYDARTTISEYSLLKLIAFCNQLVEILGDGLSTYTDDRYRRLIKLLGRLVLHTTQYVTDHLDSYAKLNSLLNSVAMTEYDLFMLRIVKILLRSKDIGTLQFLATAPFNSVSIDMLWEVYALLTSWNMYDGNQMKSEDITLEFEEQLAAANESDAFYLLSTMSSMAIAREGKDNGFVRIVTIHLFQIGFLSPKTRDSCSKHARDLLSSLTYKFPHLISVLSHSIKPKMDILENMSLYLLKELAFSSWKPTEFDTHLLSNWLLNFHPSTLESQTARFIIQSMNWNFDESGQLFLSVGIHRKLAILVVESQLKWEKSQNILTESVKQVSGINLRPQEVNFINWGWEVIRRLHLHAYDQCNDGNLRLTKYMRNLPTFEGHSELEPLRKSVEDKHPLGSFVTLLMTPWGHSLPLISSKGYDLLETLLRTSKLDAAIQALFFIMPLFSSSKDSVSELKSKRFINLISTLLLSDMSYVRMAKSLILADFPGPCTKLIGEMIDTQLKQTERFATTERNIARLWVEVLTGCESWNKDNNILYLLDILARFSFYTEECRTFFYDFFISLYRKIPENSQAGLTSSLFWWPSSNCSSLLPNPSYPQMPFLMHFMLNIEMQIENLNGFWKSVCHSMISPKSTVDSAVKKAGITSNYAAAVNYLTLYRFAQQALDAPVDSPLAIIFWQKFFLRYFHRISADEHFQGGVGDRFFEGMINSAFLKKLKRKIHDLIEHYQMTLNEVTDVDANDDLDNPAVNMAVVIEFNRNRLMLATAMALWIEDPQLHKDSLYLPALPPQFLPNKLLLLIEGSNDDWSEYVDLDSISNTSYLSMRSFLNFACRMVWVEPQRFVRSPDWIPSAGSRKEELLKRLKSYDCPIQPPDIPVFHQILPVPVPTMYVDPNAMEKGTKNHFRVLTEFAQYFSLQSSQHTSLDCSFIEALPDLYKHHESEAMVNVRCSGTRKWEPCTGPAHIHFKFKEARLNERVGHQIQVNRTEYHTLIDQKSIQPPPESVCISAVFIEDFITNLILCHRSAGAGCTDKSKIFQVGKSLFYKVVRLMNDDCDFYPPTRQLFSSFVEILGAEFVANDSSQYKHLVDTCISNPGVVGALAPHINLVNSSIDSLIDIYENVASVSKRHSDLAFVILSKLDLGGWLKKSVPKLSERTKLLSVMWKIITSEGNSPDFSSLMIYDCYRSHLKTLLLFEFPKQYGEILKMLLHSSEQQCVPVDIWFDFFNALSNSSVIFTPGMEAFVAQNQMKRFATEGCLLPYELILETIRMMSHHFTKERLSHGLYGLYPKYRTYTEPISCFFQMISYTLIASSLKRLVGGSVDQVIKAVWAPLCDLYAPWILPYDQKMIQQQCSSWIQNMNFDATSVLHPWTVTDVQHGVIFVQKFSESIVFFADNLHGASSLLSELLNFYFNNYAQPGVKDHVLGIVNNSFINLIPWRIFWPTLSDVEAMNRIVERYFPGAHSFLGCIFVQIDWTEWVNDTLNSVAQPLEVLPSKIHSLLLNLTVRLANDCVARELSLWGDTMERAMRMQWECVPATTLETILNWFVMSVDPRVVLALRSHAMETASLMLLKVASGYLDFTSDNFNLCEPSSQSNRKRYLYVRTYVRLLVSVASKYKTYLQTEVKSFESSIQNMISDLVEVVKFQEQSKEELLPPLKELFALMANHYLGTITRNAFIEWCEINKEAPLTILYCFIQCSFDNKVPSYTTAPLIETTIGLCFKHKEASWDYITKVALVSNEATELNAYFEVSYRDGHYLLLYCLFLRRFDILSRGGLNTVSFLADVVKNLKPKESNEAVLPLLGEIILKLCIQLLFDAKSGSLVEKNVKQMLSSFAMHFSALGDDKGGWGLLGALGLGQSSKLSTRGRLFCRCLSVFVLVHLPVNAPVRTKPGADGHFSVPQSSSARPHQDLIPSLEKLEGLKLVRQYSEYSECIELALTFIKDEAKCLSFDDVDNFIHKLNSHMFTEAFLIKEK